MNCQDIAHILDERGLHALSAMERAGLEAHLAECTECAGQCLASESLQGFRSEAPPLPASLRERARQLRELGQATAVQRRTRRPVIIGSLLLLGAAATMFAGFPVSDAGAAEQ